MSDDQPPATPRTGPAAAAAAPTDPTGAPVPEPDPTAEPAPVDPPVPGNRAERRAAARGAAKPVRHHGPAVHARSAQGRRVNPIRRSG